MFKSIDKVGFDSIVKNKRLMTTMMLFPYLNPWDLARLSQVNKACKSLLDSKSKICVNYKHLFEVWGLETQDVFEILRPV